MAAGYAGDWSVRAGHQSVRANNPVQLVRLLSGGRGFSLDGMYFSLSGTEGHLAAIPKARDLHVP